MNMPKAYPRIVQEEPGGPVLLKLLIEGRDIAIPLSGGEQRELCRALVEIIVAPRRAYCA